MSYREDEVKDIEHLSQEKMDLFEEIRKLDEVKIKKFQASNEELQKRVDWLEKHTKKLTKENENLDRQIKHFRARKWFNSLKMIVILGVLDLIIIPLLVAFLNIPLPWLFISLGIINFFGILVISNYMSNTNPFDTGEIRKALTGAFVVLYFVFVPLITFENILPTSEIVTTIITAFSTIVIVVIGFYFGTRGIEEFKKIKERR